MIPILYEKNETAFTSNGLGRLTDCISCIVTEERNGRYECSFEYPINGNHFDDIQIGRVIACTHDDYGDIQPFDIYAKSEPLNGVVTFNAHHISYRLNEITVKPFEAGTVALALQNIKSYSVTTNPFTFWTDRSASAQFVNDVPRKARNMLGGEENSILDVFGTGEYEFDKFTVRFYAHRGQDTNISIRYGKNLTSFTNEYDTQDVYTAVVPYWKGQNDQQQDVLVTLSEWYITSGHSVDSGRMICVPLDLSNEFDDAPTQAQLRTKAVSRISSSEAWNPNQTVKINFVQLWQTEEYKEYAPLQRVRLCDTVGIFVPMYNMSLRAKVISVVYNVLLDRYNSMTLGDKPTTYANVVEKQYDSKVAGIQEGFSSINASVNSLAQEINDKSSIYYGDPDSEYPNAKTGDYLVNNLNGSTYSYIKGKSYTLDEDGACLVALGDWESVYDEGNNVTFVYADDEDYYLGIYVKSGAVLDNIVFYPKLTLGTSTDGVNLLPFPYTDSTKTVSGITFTVNADKSVTVNGTASSSVNFALWYRNLSLTNGSKYTLANTGKWVAETDYATAIAEATDLILGGTGGYVVTVTNTDGQPIELLITDNLDINQAQNVWRWNQGGFGHSSTGYNGTYSTAITQDGKINADFIITGHLNANYIQGGTLKLGGANNANGLLEIYDSSGTRVGVWNNTALYVGNVESNLTNPNTKITTSGAITTNSLTANDYIYVDGSTTSLIRLPISTGSDYYTKIDNTGIEVKSYFQGVVGVTKIGPNGMNGILVTPPSSRTPYAQLGITAGNSPEMQLVKSSDSVTVSYYGIYIDGSSSYNTDIRDTSALFGGSVSVVGSMTVSGSKSRNVKTENYNERLLYAYESPTPLFGDIGETIIGEDGFCYVEIDDIFQEAISNKCEYQVFLQKEGQGDCWVEEKNPRYFVIKGTPNLKVSWEIKAKQKGYDIIRLEQNDLDLDEYEEHIDDSIIDSNYIEEQEELLYA